MQTFFRFKYPPEYDGELHVYYERLYGNPQPCAFHITVAPLHSTETEKEMLYRIARDILRTEYKV